MRRRAKSLMRWEYFRFNGEKQTHVKRLKNMRRVRWYAEGKDLMFNAVVLKLLVEVALIAVQNKQSVFPNLAHLCMLVKVLQPLKELKIWSGVWRT
jgi:hypothetical protein